MPSFHEDTWEASQALIVRNEASSAEKGPGKFSYPEEMKTVQETILEVVRSRSVLEAALREVGPPADCENARGLAHRPRHRRRSARTSSSFRPRGPSSARPKSSISPFGPKTAPDPWP